MLKFWAINHQIYPPIRTRIVIPDKEGLSGKASPLIPSSENQGNELSHPGTIVEEITKCDITT